MNYGELKVKETYEKRGWKVLRRGSPDFVLFKRNKSGKILDVIFVEVKREGEKLRQEQLLYKKILKSLGLKYILKRTNFIDVNSTKLKMCGLTYNGKRIIWRKRLLFTENEVKQIRERLNTNDVKIEAVRKGEKVKKFKSIGHLMIKKGKRKKERKKRIKNLKKRGLPPLIEGKQKYLRGKDNEEWILVKKDYKIPYYRYCKIKKKNVANEVKHSSVWLGERYLRGLKWAEHKVCGQKQP